MRRFELFSKFSLCSYAREIKASRFFYTFNSVANRKYIFNVFQLIVDFRNIVLRSILALRLRFCYVVMQELVVCVEQDFIYIYIYIYIYSQCIVHSHNEFSLSQLPKVFENGS